MTTNVTPIPGHRDGQEDDTPCMCRECLRIRDAEDFRCMALWLLEAGAEFSSLSFRYYSHDYRGVHLARDVKPHERLLYVPRSHLLTFQDAKATGSVNDYIQKRNYWVRSRDTFMSLCLLEERWKGANSFWYPYLRLLPKHFSDNPMFFSPQDLVLMRGSLCIPKRRVRMTDILIEWRDLVKFVPEPILQSFLGYAPDRSQDGTEQDVYSCAVDFCKSDEFVHEILKGDELASDCTAPGGVVGAQKGFVYRPAASFVQFLWARTTVITRIFGVRVNGIEMNALVPMADMLNHKLPAQTTWKYAQDAAPHEDYYQWCYRELQARAHLAHEKQGLVLSGASEGKHSKGTPSSDKSSGRDDKSTDTPNLSELPSDDALTDFSFRQFAKPSKKSAPTKPAHIFSCPVLCGCRSHAQCSRGLTSKGTALSRQEPSDPSCPAPPGYDQLSVCTARLCELAASLRLTSFRYPPCCLQYGPHACSRNLLQHDHRSLHAASVLARSIRTRGGGCLGGVRAVSVPLPKSNPQSAEQRMVQLMGEYELTALQRAKRVFNSKTGGWAMTQESRYSKDAPMPGSVGPVLKGGFTIVSKLHLQRTDPLYDSYGQKCNSRFFVNYGFALRHNPDNQCVLVVDPVGDSWLAGMDAHRRRRLHSLLEFRRNHGGWLFGVRRRAVQGQGQQQTTDQGSDISAPLFSAVVPPTQSDSEEKQPISSDQGQTSGVAPWSDGVTVYAGYPYFYPQSGSPAPLEQARYLAILPFAGDAQTAAATAQMRVASTDQLQSDFAFFLDDPQAMPGSSGPGARKRMVSVFDQHDEENGPKGGEGPNGAVPGAPGSAAETTAPEHKGSVGGAGKEVADPSVAVSCLCGGRAMDAFSAVPLTYASASVHADVRRPVGLKGVLRHLAGARGLKYARCCCQHTVTLPSEHPNLRFTPPAVRAVRALPTSVQWRMPSAELRPLRLNVLNPPPGQEGEGKQRAPSVDGLPEGDQPAPPQHRIAPPPKPARGFIASLMTRLCGIGGWEEEEPEADVWGRRIREHGPVGDSDFIEDGYLYETCYRAGDPASVRRDLLSSASEERRASVIQVRKEGSVTRLLRSRDLFVDGGFWSHDGETAVKGQSTVVVGTPMTDDRGDDKESEGAKTESDTTTQSSASAMPTLAMRPLPTHYDLDFLRGHSFRACQDVQTMKCRLWGHGSHRFQIPSSVTFGETRSLFSLLRVKNATVREFCEKPLNGFLGGRNPLGRGGSGSFRYQAGRDAINRDRVGPVSVHNELRVLRELAALASETLRHFSCSAEEDMEILYNGYFTQEQIDREMGFLPPSHPHHPSQKTYPYRGPPGTVYPLTSRQQSSVIVRHGEKLVLRWFADLGLEIPHIWGFSDRLGCGDWRRDQRKAVSDRVKAQVRREVLARYYDASGGSAGSIDLDGRGPDPAPSDQTVTQRLRKAKISRDNWGDVAHAKLNRYLRTRILSRWLQQHVAGCDACRGMLQGRTSGLAVSSTAPCGHRAPAGLCPKINDTGRLLQRYPELEDDGVYVQLRLYALGHADRSPSRFWEYIQSVWVHALWRV